MNLSETHRADEYLAMLTLALEAGAIAASAAVQDAFEVGIVQGRLVGLREARTILTDTP